MSASAGLPAWAPGGLVQTDLGSRCGPSVPRASQRTVCAAGAVDRHQHNPGACCSCFLLSPGSPAEGLSPLAPPLPLPGSLHVATCLRGPATSCGYRGRASSRSVSSEEGSGPGPRYTSSLILCKRDPALCTCVFTSALSLLPCGEDLAHLLPIPWVPSALSTVSSPASDLPNWTVQYESVGPRLTRPCFVV